MNGISNDPLFGVLNTNSEDEFLKWGEDDSFDMEKYLIGSERDSGLNKDSWINDDEVELVADLFKPKTEIVDQGQIYINKKVSTAFGNGQICAKIESTSPVLTNARNNLVRATAKAHILLELPPSSSPEIPYYGVYDQQHDSTEKIKRKPRKYNLKPHEVKKTPIYKEKRIKNNDAVRKCREKAKLKQQEKDDLLSYYIEENEQLKIENEDLKAQMAFLAGNCHCGLFVEVKEEDHF